jgi:hypothetical protein
MRVRIERIFWTDELEIKGKREKVISTCVGIGFLIAGLINNL